MTTMTITEFAKSIKKTMDRIEYGHEEIVLVRNHHKIAKIVPGCPHMTAREVMGDLYRTIPESAGKTWLEDSKIHGKLNREMKDPWGS